MQISIVLPSYNHAKFIRECVDGVLGQTHQDWELLVLDDGSKDVSPQILQEYAAKDGRIKWLPNEKNLGAYATENRGIDLASYDWIAILNSDDAWLPNKLELQVKELEANPECIFCYTLGTIIDENSQPFRTLDHHKDYPTDSPQNVLPYLFHINQLLASSLIFKKGSVRFEQDFGYSGDWVAALRLSRQSKGAFVNEPMTLWRQHGDNSSKKIKETIGEEVRVRRWILENGLKWISSAYPDDIEIARVKLGWSALDLAAHLFLGGEVAEAKRVCVLALDCPDPLVRKIAKRRTLSMYLPRSIAKNRFMPGVEDFGGEGLLKGLRPLEG